VEKGITVESFVDYYAHFNSLEQAETVAENYSDVFGLGWLYWLIP